MKKLLPTLAFVAALAAPQLASAVTIFSATVGGGPIGNDFVTFDNLPLGNGGGISNGVDVSFTGAGQTVQGSQRGVYAAPFLSGDNGDDFGFAPGFVGQDPTKYLTTGIGTIELELASSSFYFGLLWGSVDTFNTLTFYDGATELGSFTGVDVDAAANGDRGLNGTLYVNITSDVAFNRVVASSTNFAFELDNVSYNNSNRVPDGGATLALLGSVMGGFVLLRRFKK